MKKLSLYIFLVLMWCNIGLTFDLADERILGKDNKPHIIFRCHDVNDTNMQKVVGLTPVTYNDNSYYVVSYSEDGGESFFAGESTVNIMNSQCLSNYTIKSFYKACWVF